MIREVFGRPHITASMRPPAIQAERLLLVDVGGGSRAASMRPPAIQAERKGGGPAPARAAPGFNEAACNTGGTPRAYGQGHPAGVRFNEAACNTGGTQPIPTTRTTPASWLQ